MIRFLDAPAARREAKRLLSGYAEAVLAVAFWGKGAKEQLGLTKQHAGKVEIFCDPESGACNPNALQELIELGLDVRARRKLHAKVLWTPNAVLVGSSNVSANGLGFEGSELTANLEANILTDDAGTVSAVRKWLIEHVRPGRKLDPALMKRCREAWKRRQANRPPTPYPSRRRELLSELATSATEWLAQQPIEVWAFFDSDVSKESKEQLTNVHEQTGYQSLEQFEVHDLSVSQAGKTVLWFSRYRGQHVFKCAYKMVDIKPQLTLQDSKGRWFNHYCRPLPPTETRLFDHDFLEQVSVELPKRRPRGELQLRCPISQFLAGVRR